ncbi:recombinase family protein [Micromonospora gifhornensis]|uniref:recombinase family protein n=1 Tax=Micromonospora gifhornensis TaxID=84594 RepID=UPI00345645FB
MSKPRPAQASWPSGPLFRRRRGRRGWTVVAWKEDRAASGKSLGNRPALGEALELVESHWAATQVVAELDRLSRSLVDFAGLINRARAERWNVVALELGIDLSTPASEFLASVMASAAQWERRIIGQRIREGLAAKKTASIRLGRPITLPADVRHRIRSEANSGSSLFCIARGLNADEAPRDATPAAVQLRRSSTGHRVSAAISDGSSDLQFSSSRSRC